MVLITVLVCVCMGRLIQRSEKINGLLRFLSSHVCRKNFSKHLECLGRNLGVKIWQPNRLYSQNCPQKSDECLKEIPQHAWLERALNRRIDHLFPAPSTDGGGVASFPSPPPRAICQANGPILEPKTAFDSAGHEIYEYTAKFLSKCQCRYISG